MKMLKKTAPVLAVLLLTIIAVSCESTGRYMPLATGETIIGTVQTTFMVQSDSASLKKDKDTLNEQAYSKLMEIAGQKYTENIDLRDVTWVIINKLGNKTETEIFATARVIRVE